RLTPGSAAIFAAPVGRPARVELDVPGSAAIFAAQRTMALGGRDGSAWRAVPRIRYLGCSGQRQAIRSDRRRSVREPTAGLAASGGVVKPRLLREALDQDSPAGPHRSIAGGCRAG